MGFKELREPFESLLELTASAREIELARIAAREPELAREIAALLAADAAPNGLLDGTAAPFLALLATPRRRPD